MSRGLAAEQTVPVVRTFAHAEYPDKEEGKDYRTPDASRFREWRNTLESVSHYMAVSRACSGARARAVGGGGVGDVSGGGGGGWQASGPEGPGLPREVLAGKGLTMGLLGIATGPRCAC